MHSSRLLFAVPLLAALAVPSAFALDFKSVGNKAVILYETPSDKGVRRYIAPPGMPLQVMNTYGPWLKVRDMNGDEAWTPVHGLVTRQTVLVRTPGAAVHAGPDDGSAVLMTADKGVLLELADPSATVWARVRHRDGINGYIKVSDIWGL